MSLILGIRAEDKNKWEKRSPLIPVDATELMKNQKVEIVIQSSSQRIFNDSEYSSAGLEVLSDIDKADIILGVKEIPVKHIRKNKVYVFFSHVIKGQSYNMSMLQRIMDLNCTLIDYERIVNEKNQRLISFGRFAGLAGMIDTFWGLGQRVQIKSIETFFLKIKQAIEYNDLDEAKKDVS